MGLNAPFHELGVTAVNQKNDGYGRPDICLDSLSP